MRLEPTREIEIVEELAQHLEDRYREMLARGTTENAALRAALLELSDRKALYQELHGVERIVRHEPVILGARRKNLMRDLWQDLRYSVRAMLRQPGFTATAVLKLILRQGLLLVLAGTGLGLGMALLLTRVISDLLFEVSPTDLVTFISVPLVIAGVALTACYIPARRAIKVDPFVALRDE